MLCLCKLFKVINMKNKSTKNRKTFSSILFYIPVTRFVKGNPCVIYILYKPMYNWSIKTMASSYNKKKTSHHSLKV